MLGTGLHDVVNVWFVAVVIVVVASFRMHATPGPNI